MRSRQNETRSILPAVRNVHALVNSGLMITLAQAGDVLDDPGFRADYVAHLHLSWQLSARFGSPLTATLERFIDACEADEERERLIRTATAGARMATRIVLLLPLGAVVILSALGFDVLGVLFGTPIGWLCIVVAASLVIAGAWWSHRQVAAAARSTVLPGFGYGLVATGVRAGASVEHILHATRSTPLCAREFTHVSALAQASVTWGIPLAGLLEGLAQSTRADEEMRVREAIAQLGEKTLLPLGICVLPAFLVLVAVPAVLSALSATGGFSALVSTG